MSDHQGHQDPDRVSALRATAHPVRLRMLSLLTNNELSASDLARELGTTTANASYHLRFLARAGLVVEAGTEQIRGGVAKRYTHPWEVGTSITGSDPAERQAWIRTLADELVLRAASRRSPGPMFTADADLWVAPEVKAEALELLTRASALLHGAARPPRAEDTVRVSLTAALFEMEPDA